MASERARRTGVIAVACATLLVSACASTPDGRAGEGSDPPASKTQVTPVSLDAGTYFGLAWPSSDQLVVGTMGGEEFRLIWMDREGKIEPLPLEDDPSCRVPRSDINVTDWMFPTTMPSGDLALVRSCRGNNDQALRVSAFDIRTSQLTTIFESPDFVGPRPTFWNRDASRGISSLSDDICATVVWLEEDSLEALGVTIEDGETNWTIDLGAARDCEDEGRADWPSWSGTGPVSFFAETESKSESNFGRLDVPYDLYLLDPGDSAPRLVMKDVLEPRSPVWTRDGTQLAFSVLRGSNKGTWVYNSPSDTAHRISDVSLLWLAWAPDGSEIAGITEEADDDSGSISEGRVVILNDLDL